MQEFVTSKGWDAAREQTPADAAQPRHFARRWKRLRSWSIFNSASSPARKTSLAEELADVALYLLQLASVSDIDLETGHSGQACGQCDPGMGC